MHPVSATEWAEHGAVRAGSRAQLPSRDDALSLRPCSSPSSCDTDGPQRGQRRRDRQRSQRCRRCCLNRLSHLPGVDWKPRHGCSDRPQSRLPHGPAQHTEAARSSAPFAGGTAQPPGQERTQSATGKLPRAGVRAACGHGAGTRCTGTPPGHNGRSRSAPAPSRHLPPHVPSSCIFLGGTEGEDREEVTRKFAGRVSADPAAKPRTSLGLNFFLQEGALLKLFSSSWDTGGGA